VSPSEREPPESLSALLAAPACAAIAAPLRKALLEHGRADDATRDPPAVIADTLSALAQLEADGDVLAAAVLHVVPALRERAGILILVVVVRDALRPDRQHLQPLEQRRRHHLGVIPAGAAQRLE